MMTKKAVTLFLVLIGCIIPAGSFASQNDRVIIKVATLAPKGSMAGNLITKLCQDITAATNDEVGLKVYYGGVQGDAKDVLRKIKFKQLHGAALASYGLGQIAPEVRVTGLPYVFRNYGEVRYVRSKLQDYMEQAFEKKGYVVLGWYDIGFVYSFSKVPITSVEVARQQKFWAPEGDPLAQAVYRALGISPVSLSITDVLTSLSTRLIDAASAPPLAAVAFRWYTKFSYMNEYPSTNVLGALVVTKDIWDKISPQNQTAVRALTRECCRQIQVGHQEQNQKSIDLLKQSGLTIVRVKNAKTHRQFIDDTAEKTMQALVGNLFSQELLDETLAHLADYRKTHPDSTVEKIK
jgi:TRAP-type C4-dicarboxylate transport system substrate-binding protein